MSPGDTGVGDTGIPGTIFTTFCTSKTVLTNKVYSNRKEEEKVSSGTDPAPSSRRFPPGRSPHLSGVPSKGGLVLTHSLLGSVHSPHEQKEESGRLWQQSFPTPRPGGGTDTRYVAAEHGSVTGRPPYLFSLPAPPKSGNPVICKAGC